ncbi:GNAT family N-acetyltransferase [Izhakiella australiensis]|uniref:GNAT family N-acetyltransferase n=1 Tax=Izhakiella australiensis TaxID=1926881 RepID=A0A1S8YTB1_9GAMM|nr:GNAT family N-acetyltransferase [Izhakiella australiensis]OON41883.1 GNAT family N-acetyltransferase [Izhakiella australiensis]
MDITLRGVEPDDATAYHRIHSHPDNFCWTLQLPMASVAMWRTKLEQNVQNGNIGFVAEMAGEVVGEMTLFTNLRPRTRHTVSFGISVDRGYVRRGIASQLMKAGIDYAFNWLGARRLELEVFVDNQSAIGLYRKFGFQSEGVQRQAALKNGEYCDVMIMSLLRDERPAGG